MKVLGMVALALGAAYCYIDTDLPENRISTPVPFRTFFFLKRFSAPYGTSSLNRPLPLGAHKRLESQEKFSPFHTMLLFRKGKKSEDIFDSMLRQTESTESFIRDFLATHLKNTKPREASPKQFNTEKIYNDLYRKSKYPPTLPSKTAAHAAFLGDEIDNIMAHAVKSLADAPEEEEHKESFGKNVGRAKKRVRKHIKKAKKVISKGFKFNGLTIILFAVVALLSGYAGYAIRGKSSSEHFVSLAK